MKSLLIAALVVVSLPCFAQEGETAISFQPTLPVNCKTSDSPHVNWIYMIAKTSETPDSAEFSILAQDGFCKDKEFQERELDGKSLAIEMAEDAFLLPWESDPVKVSSEVLNNSVLRAHFNFDLKRLFLHNKNKAVFYMYFYPTTNMRMAYTWRVVLTKTPDQGIGLEILTAARHP